jgi:hypothetical protein
VAASPPRRASIVAIPRDLHRTRLSKCAYRGDERYASHRFVKAPTECLYDRELPEGALMVLALIGQHSIIRRRGVWLRDWCSLPPSEMARQLKVSNVLVRAALSSPYVESGPGGYRVRMTDEGQRWCPLPFGPLGSADDAPALSAREYLLLALQVHRELAGAPALDCTALAAITRTCSGRSVSAVTVAKSLKSMQDRGWIAAELAEPMRAAHPLSISLFNSSISEHIPANAQVEAPVERSEPKPLDKTLDLPISSSALTSRSEGGKASPVRAEGAVFRTRTRSERRISPPDRPDVAQVRSVFGQKLGQEVAASGVGRCANEWIAMEIDRGTPVERLAYRVSGAVLRLETGELYRRDGVDGLVRFVRFALARPHGCPDLGCEDGLQWDYANKRAGDACRACRERRLALADAKRPPRSSPERPAALAGSEMPPAPPQALSVAPRACCRECEAPFGDGVGPRDGICRGCRADSLERQI